MGRDIVSAGFRWDKGPWLVRDLARGGALLKVYYIGTFWGYPTLLGYRFLHCHRPYNTV